GWARLSASFSRCASAKRLTESVKACCSSVKWNCILRIPQVVAQIWLPAAHAGAADVASAAISAAAANTSSRVSALAFAFPTIDLLYRSFPRKRKVILDPSFRVDADGLPRVGPHRQLAVDDGGVRRGCGGLRLGAFDGKAPTHLLGHQRGVECSVERVDDGARRPRRRGEAPSQRHVVAR